MAYRDENKALLERLDALERELRIARKEIARLRGEPAPDAPVRSTEANEIIEELASARAILAGLIGDEEASSEREPKSARRSVDPAIEALKRALRTTLVRKLGAIDERTRNVIDAQTSADDLIDLIAAVALASDVRAIRELFRSV